MNDLMGSIKGGEKSTLNFQASDANRDVELGLPQPPEAPTEKAMDSFFKEVAQIKELLALVRTKQRELEENHEKGKTVTRSDEMRELRDAMQRQMDEVQTIVKQIKDRLEALDKANAAAIKKKGAEQGSAQERTRTAITAALRTKLVDLAASFQELRQRLQADYRQVVERRVYTVTGKQATEQEVEQMIETGESEAIFQKAIMEQGRGHVTDTLQEIQDRHDAVRQLEQSLMDVHQMFLDMAVLVESQGEMLNNIEAQVARSVEYVQGGTTALIQAKSYQKGTRKLICCAIVIILIIVAIVVVVAIQPWKH